MQHAKKACENACYLVQKAINTAANCENLSEKEESEFFSNTRIFMKIYFKIKFTEHYRNRCHFSAYSVQ